MTASFTWEALPARVLCGRGYLDRVGDEVERLGARRVLLVGGGAATGAPLQRVRSQLGDRVAEVIPESAQHVPEVIAGQAVERGRGAAIDAVVSVGGGSATGLGKAVVLELGVPLIAVPTTYAGSEMTPIHGRTREGRKETGRDPWVLPRSVVYDPEVGPRLGGNPVPGRRAAACGLRPPGRRRPCRVPGRCVHGGDRARPGRDRGPSPHLPRPRRGLESAARRDPQHRGPPCGRAGVAARSPGDGAARGGAGRRAGDRPLRAGIVDGPAHRPRRRRNARGRSRRGRRPSRRGERARSPRRWPGPAARNARGRVPRQPAGPTPRRHTALTRSRRRRR
ncbi:MAG: maleylacetate reductase [Chloroflexi bacterium]|nr:MAG: maleylacetate reductase [Chloroflexota bacterium]